VTIRISHFTQAKICLLKLDIERDIVSGVDRKRKASRNKELFDTSFHAYESEISSDLLSFTTFSFCLQTYFIILTKLVDEFIDEARKRARRVNAAVLLMFGKS